MIKVFIIHLTLCLTVIGCAIPEEPASKDSLECLLRTYLEYRPEHLNGEVLVEYTEGWSDSTAIIGILTINTKEQEWIGTFYVSHYMGQKIYLGVSKFENERNTTELPLDAFPISSSLRFKEVYINTENKGNLNSEFAEIQLEYHIPNKCIQNLILGNENARAVFSNCEWCK